MFEFKYKTAISYLNPYIPIIHIIGPKPSWSEPDVGPVK